MYIPITTTFRVCDIWRGYWAQRLLWEVRSTLVIADPSLSAASDWWPAHVPASLSKAIPQRARLCTSESSF
jgi:hypothetical protein